MTTEKTSALSSSITPVMTIGADPQTDSRARLRIGDVVVGPKAFLPLTQDIMKAAEQGDSQTATEQVAWDNLFNGIWRVALAWWDDAEQQITAQDLRRRAIGDAHHLDHLCAAIPDGAENDVGSGYKWASGIVTKGLAGINHGPLEWGWTAVQEGARPDDPGAPSIDTFGCSDFTRWAAMDPRSDRLARVLDFVGTWPERIRADVLFLGPQIGQHSIDFRTDDLSAPTYQHFEDQPTLMLALSRGAWTAAELIWNRTTPQDSVAATNALRAVLQHLFSAEQLSGRDGWNRDGGAPLRWAQRLVAAGADINAVISGRYLGPNGPKPHHRGGRRRSPPAWRINSVIAPDEQAAWISGRPWSVAPEYARPNDATQLVRMTLSELAAMTLFPIAVTQTQDGAHTGAWAQFWVDQWATTPPVLLLPWHAHGSILDVVAHHGLWEARRGRSGAAVQEAFDLAVQQLSVRESQQRGGWWTRPPTNDHPWPAWEMAVQAWIQPSKPIGRGHGLMDVLLDTINRDAPVPLWVVRDAATAVLETALTQRSQTGTQTRPPEERDSGTQGPNHESDPWTLVEQLADLSPRTTRSAVDAWVADARRILQVIRTGRTPDGALIPDENTAQSVRDKLTLLATAFPVDRPDVEPVARAPSRPRSM